MNWEAIGAVAEFVGATAVVLTLIYLARETAKNSKAVDATSSRSIALHTSSFNLEIARDPELTSIFLKSYQLEEQEYSEEEWFKFTLAATSLMQTWQAQIMHGNLGLGDDEEVQLNIDFTSGLIRTFPVWKKYWQNAREVLPYSFVQKIEQNESALDLSEMLKPPNT